MGPSATDRPIIVEDVITALTGGMGGVPPRTLRTCMERAAVDFDERTAEAFARALFVELSAQPQDLRGLEALLILGLAHPKVLAKHGISLETEGRRLAAVFENNGETQRARQLLEMLANNLPSEAVAVNTTPETSPRREDSEQTIERLLRRADECIAHGYNREAIQNLQEVLLLDRSRRDVGRMIRDLRERERDSGVQRKRTLKIALVAMLVGGAGFGLVLREQHVRMRWDELPAAVKNDPAALQARLDAIQSLLAEEHVWTGVFQAWQERDALQFELQELQETAARTAREAALEKLQRAQQAEDARTRGMMNAQHGRFDAALGDLRMALDLGGEHWEYKPRVLADIAAIESWRARKP